MKNCIPILICCLFFSCSKNAFKAYEKGDLGDAYSILYKKAKKKDIKRKEMTLFRKVLREMIHEDSLNYYKNAYRSTLDGDIIAYNILSNISKKDEEISGLRYRLPQYTFYSHKTYDSLSYAVSDKLFDRAQYALIEAETSGRKEPARDAYADLDKISDFHLVNPNQIKRTKAFAKKLGTEYTLVSAENKDFFNNKYIDRYLDVDDINVPEDTWRKTHYRIKLDYDYSRIIELILEDSDFDNDEKNSSKKYAQKVITGTTQDSLQNPIYTEVNATLNKRSLNRELRIDGYLRIQEADSRTRKENIRVRYDQDIEQYSFSGDERALPDSEKNKLNNQEQFASDENFFREAIQQFIAEANEEIRKYMR